MQYAPSSCAVIDPTGDAVSVDSMSALDLRCHHVPEPFPCNAASASYSSISNKPCARLHAKPVGGSNLKNSSFP